MTDYLLIDTWCAVWCSMFHNGVRSGVFEVCSFVKKTVLIYEQNVYKTLSFLQTFEHD